MTSPPSRRQGRPPALDPADVRKPRGIAFSDYEWNLIKAAAARDGTTPGALVRDAALEWFEISDPARRQAARSPNKDSSEGEQS